MRITPLDIRNHPFRKRFSGYDREEVDAFLQMIAEDWEGLLRESEGLREQTVKLEVRVEDLSANEQVLRETLTTAQKLSEDLKRTAVKEAEVMVGEAEIKGEKILAAAHRRAAKLADEIREMKSLRTRLSQNVRAAIETHLSLLDGLSADDPENSEPEGNVSYLTRSIQTAKSSGEG
jgi:cell division initiation protein